MNDLYTILINEDHSFTHTNVKRIMHRSKLIDSIRFLVKPEYNDLDMTKVNTVLEYITPISHKYKTIVLKQSDELYKNRVEFILPIDTDFTSEIGKLQMTINFSYLSVGEDGNFKEQVRPIGTTFITIEETPNWSDYIPSADLDNIAQIMMANQSIAEQNREDIEMLHQSRVTSLKHDLENNTLHLINNSGEKVGEAVPVQDLDACDCEEGVPAVEFSVMQPDDDDENVNNVVVF